MQQVLSSNHKYALIALDGTLVDRKMPLVVKTQCNSNLIAVHFNPISCTDYWKRELGSIFTKRLESSDLYLVVSAPSDTIDVLNGENKSLLNHIYHFYVGLLVAKSVKCNSNPIKITGSRYDDNITIRQVTELDCPRRLIGSDYSTMQISEEDIIFAARFSKFLKRVYGGESFSRLKRVMRAFVVGVAEPYSDLRLRQFVRCIEGFILPEPGKTTKQMKSRTEVFIGQGHHDLIGEIYEVRSKIEHMHNAMNSIKGKDAREKSMRIYQLSFIAEGIARYLIQQISVREDLWDDFEHDEKLRNFWKNDPTSKWGCVFDIDRYISSFRKDRIPNA